MHPTSVADRVKAEADKLLRAGTITETEHAALCKAAEGPSAVVTSLSRASLPVPDWIGPVCAGRSERTAAGLRNSAPISQHSVVVSPRRWRLMSARRRSDGAWSKPYGVVRRRPHGGRAD
jgi:hypothetical protein